MHTEPIIRAEIRRAFEAMCLAPSESSIIIRTFDAKVDSKRPVSAVTKESTKVWEFCKNYGISPASGQRKVSGEHVTVINQISISCDTAARIIGKQYIDNLAESRRRRETVAFFELNNEQHAAFMKQTKGLDEQTFDGIAMIARYIREHPGLNIHQRTIRLPGIDTKFVEHHRRLIEMLLKDGEFKLKDHRSVEIIVCYRDPQHIKTSSRHCDVIIPGYSDTPFEYVPTCIVICENKHSAMFMHPREGLITMMGIGYSASARVLTDLRIAKHPRLVYWGDLDIEGMEILTNIRKAGVSITSICMDQKTASKYKQYSVKPSHTSTITVNPMFLTGPERGALRMLEAGTIQRIEQEKLPENYVSHQLDLVLKTKTPHA